VRVNRRAADAMDWRAVERDGAPWLYRLQTERGAGEGREWLSGAAALEWARVRYHQLCAYLQDAVAASHLGAVMSDGGELPSGILGEMDEGVWAGLEQRFLAASGAIN